MHAHTFLCPVIRVPYLHCTIQGSIHMSNYYMLMLKGCWQITVKCLEKRVALSKWHNAPFGYRGSIFFLDSEPFRGSTSLTWDVRFTKLLAWPLAHSQHLLHTHHELDTF